MESKTRRPIPVIIAQILMILVSLILLFFIGLFLFIFIPSGREPWIIAAYAALFLPYPVLIGLFLAAFWGMARRRRYGRWLGVVSLSLLAVYGISVVVGKIAQMKRELNSSISFEPMTGDVALIIVVVLIVVLLIGLTGSLAISKGVGAFFSGKDVDIPEQNLP